jgi:hypothetical protein
MRSPRDFLKKITTTRRYQLLPSNNGGGGATQTFRELFFLFQGDRGVHLLPNLVLSFTIPDSPGLNTQYCNVTEHENAFNFEPVLEKARYTLIQQGKWLFIYWINGYVYCARKVQWKCYRG